MLTRNLFTADTVKQLIKKLSATPVIPSQNDVAQRAVAAPLDSQAALRANKATFFFQLVCVGIRTRLISPLLTPARKENLKR